MMKRLYISFLICSVLVGGCGWSDTIQAQVSHSSESFRLEQARDNEVLRLNYLPETRDNYFQFLREGDTAIVNEPGIKFLETKDRLICSLNQLGFKQSIFSKVRVVTGHPPDDMRTVLELKLPITTGVPAGCQLPLGTHGMH
jgi:hypothetical protein